MGESVFDITAGRELFGRVAIQLGYVSEVQLEEALIAQREALQAGFRKKLGTVLVSLGYMNEVQCQVIQSQQNLTPMAVRIGGFEVIHRLGSGGMGTVYKARQMSLDRVVALKVLRSELARDPLLRERFLAEARIMARLNHPNIVAGIAVGCEGGQYFLAMEFVDGEALAEKILSYREGLPEREALEYIRQVAHALQHAHNRRLLHRDIKPENIMLTHDGQAKLTDLGLARAFKPAENRRITRYGLTVGTPHYLSPEQAQGTDKLTRATDLYALGATLYHLLTGRVPYDAKTCAAVMLKHISDPVPDPRTVRPRLSAAASSICMKLMQKSPRDRYPSAVNLAEDLERVLKHQPLRNVELVPHPTRRLEPVGDRRLFRQSERNGTPKRPHDGNGERATKVGGLDHIVHSIVKRLGL